MLKIHLEPADDYPELLLVDPHDAEEDLVAVEVPTETADRWRAVWGEFSEAQKEMWAACRQASSQDQQKPIERTT